MPRQFGWNCRGLSVFPGTIWVYGQGLSRNTPDRPARRGCARDGRQRDSSLSARTNARRMCAIERTQYAGGIIGRIGGFMPGDFGKIAAGESGGWIRMRAAGARSQAQTSIYETDCNAASFSGVGHADRQRSSQRALQSPAYTKSSPICSRMQASFAAPMRFISPLVAMTRSNRSRCALTRSAIEQCAAVASTICRLLSRSRMR